MNACTHGMPSPASCIECMNEGVMPPPPKPQPVTVEYAFTAKFDGHCGACNLPTSAGERIAKLSSGAYVHEACV